MRLGHIVEAKREGNIVRIQFEESTAYIEFIELKIVRFFIPIMEEKRFKETSIIEKKERRDKEVKIEMTRENDGLIVKTEQLMIKVYNEFKVDIYDSNGNVLCRDYKASRVREEAVEPNDNIQEKEGHNELEQKKGYKIEVIKQMEHDEYFYGLGDKTGFLNKKGYSYEMWNTDNPAPHVESFKRLYKSVPFLITLRENCVFAMFFNNTFKSYYDLGKENSNYYYFAADDGDLDYYFIYGNHMKEVIQGYTSLTGRTNRPPLWSLGYHQSRWGYHTAEDVKKIADQFRKLEIPCDTIHLDLSYMEGSRVFTWNKRNFTEPKKLIDELKDKGFKVVTIIDPGVKKEKGYLIYEEGAKNKYFAKKSNGEVYSNEVWPGEVAYPNFAAEKVRKWWGEKHKVLLDVGVAGIWNDMNEPVGFKGEIPDDIVFENNGEQFLHKQIHNIYGHLMSMATFESLKKTTQQRPFVLTRACYSGTQRYAAVWTGDNHSLWQHLQMSISQLCNLGLSGFSFAGSDVGGYGGDVTRELLIRWYQVGCFYPLFRNHTILSSRSQEPWTFDEECLEIIKKYIELRYQLLPYLYDCFIEEESTGIPVMRPLVLHYQEDKLVRELNDEFMVGKYMLIAPIVEQGKSYRSVYLPEGRWIDYWTGKELQGKQVILKEAPIDVCPIYINANGMIPMYEVMQYVGERKVERLKLNIYSEDAEYIHYQDNGIDYAYEQGEYNIYKFVIENNQFKVSLIHKGYQSVYKVIEILYKGKKYNIDFKDEYIEVNLNKVI